MHGMLLFIQQYGYIGILLLLSLGIIGLPIPDEVLLTYVGYLVSKDFLSYPLALFSSILGAVVGITISYFLGLKLGLPFLLKVGPKVYLTQPKIERAQAYFRKYGVIMLVVGYFIPGVRQLIGYFAGMANLPLKKFFFYSFVGASFWGITFITLGRSLGRNWDIVAQFIKAHIIDSGIGLLCLVVLGIALYSTLRKKKKNS